ncbi:hypothetical protein LX16_5345 [Stackebrandtia albiflava]|uniref:Uncharacterized protein n=1 Tax=Stackebrandtia albiflava TaxID=406432 RepID=A0A562UL81_9ACTN|nr:hypothetical protein [Stackebrandtia albiflava]TWJ06381.1 hypothetical protein LX16_5345 [Stackebrandtia albiflava]
MHRGPYNAPGGVPLARLADIHDESMARRAKGILAAVFLVLLGVPMILAVPYLLVHTVGMQVWLGVLAATCPALVIGLCLWFTIGTVRRARREGEPRRGVERLMADHIDVEFADGTRRSLPLHAPDLRLEEVAGTHSVPADQHVLGATGYDGHPVRVLIVHTSWRSRRRGYRSMAGRQPDQVLEAIARVAADSPHSAGHEVARRLRWFIGTQVTTKGWRH